MRTVIAAAAAAFLLLGFSAHSAERVPAHNAMACILGGGTMQPAASPRANCCDVNHKCSQYITTETLIRGPLRGRT